MVPSGHCSEMMLINGSGFKPMSVPKAMKPEAHPPLAGGYTLVGLLLLESMTLDISQVPTQPVLWGHLSDTHGNMAMAMRPFP